MGYLNSISRQWSGTSVGETISAVALLAIL